MDINEKFNVTEKDRIAGLSSMCFDLSVYDIFGSLISGATLIQIPDIRDVKTVMQIVEEEEVTIWNSVPAIMDMTIDGDRKSTLLNSSHANISYAVFCLKKKKTFSIARPRTGQEPVSVD